MLKIKILVAFVIFYGIDPLVFAEDAPVVTRRTAPDGVRDGSVVSYCWPEGRNVVLDDKLPGTIEGKVFDTLRGVGNAKTPEEYASFCTKKSAPVFEQDRDFITKVVESNVKKRLAVPGYVARYKMYLLVTLGDEKTPAVVYLAYEPAALFKAGERHPSVQRFLLEEGRYRLDYSPDKKFDSIYMALNDGRWSELGAPYSILQNGATTQPDPSANGNR